MKSPGVTLCWFSGTGNTRLVIDELASELESAGRSISMVRIQNGSDPELPADAALGHNPLWDHDADCAFPCATENEINDIDAQNLVNKGVSVVSEGANMPTTHAGVDIFLDNKLLYGPGKAANAGGVAVSGLEMSQNSMRVKWTREEVDTQLKRIMTNIHSTCLSFSEEYNVPANYVVGANIAGFVKVAEAMIDQGVV
jgi:glutamate dehydrogenase (NADP+)